MRLVPQFAFKSSLCRLVVMDLRRSACVFAARPATTRPLSLLHSIPEAPSHSCQQLTAAQVARIAKMMVTQMGMSEKLGQVAWANSGGPSFLGAQMGQSSDCSMATTDLIDSEVKEIVERAYRCRHSCDIFIVL